MQHVLSITIHASSYFPRSFVCFFSPWSISNSFSLLNCDFIFCSICTCSYSLINILYSPSLSDYRSSIFYCSGFHFGVNFSHTFSSCFELLFYDFNSRNVSGCISTCSAEITRSTEHPLLVMFSRSASYSAFLVRLLVSIDNLLFQFVNSIN